MRQRLALRIEPLDRPGLAAYVRHRLKRAGAGDREVFAEDVFGEVLRYTGGLPKLINVLCDKALGLAENHSSDTVSLKDIREAVRDLKWSEYVPKAVPVADAAPVAAEEPAPETRARPQAPARSFASAPAASTRGSLGAPTLILQHRGIELRRVALKEGRLAIGRAPESGLQIDSPWISRSHCQIVTGNAGCFVEDLGSTNGVIVNLKRIRVHRLKHDDVITLGEHTLTFTLGELSEPSSSDS
jgi:hypothetical protein